MVLTFLSLPREIRDQIYALALVHSGITTYRHSNGTHSFYQYPSSLRFSLSLLSTTHKIRHEATAVFNTNTLHLIGLESISHQPPIVRDMQHLEVHFEASFNSCWMYAEIVELLHTWPSLRSVCLNVGGCEPLGLMLREGIFDSINEPKQLGERLGVTQAWFVADVTKLDLSAERLRTPRGDVGGTGVFVKLDLDSEVRSEWVYRHGKARGTSQHGSGVSTVFWPPWTGFERMSVEDVKCIMKGI